MNLQERKQFLIRKQKGKEVLSAYLHELNALFNCPLMESDLLSLERTDNAKKEYSDKIQVYPTIKTTFPFQSKHLLQECITELTKQYQRPVLVFTKYSGYCGAALLESLNCFNIFFNFKDEHVGIVSIISENLENKLTLEFYEERMVELITIEATGKLWSNVTFPLTNL